MNPLRCGHPEGLAVEATQSCWGTDTLRYFQTIVYPGVDPNRVAANYVAATKYWESVCNIHFVPAESPGVADVLASASPIDGPYNVLAISELPPTAEFAGTLTQTFDVAETWLDDKSMVTMIAHELGHILGLGHLATGNLMAPILDPSLDGPQAADIAEVVARYGPPVAQASPAPLTPTPGQFVCTTTVHIEKSGPVNIVLDVNVPAEGYYTVEARLIPLNPS